MVHQNWRQNSRWAGEGSSVQVCSSERGSVLARRTSWPWCHVVVTQPRRSQVQRPPVLKWDIVWAQNRPLHPPKSPGEKQHHLNVNYCICVSTNSGVCATSESLPRQGNSSPLSGVATNVTKAYSQTWALIYLPHYLLCLSDKWCKLCVTSLFQSLEIRLTSENIWVNQREGDN